MGTLCIILLIAPSYALFQIQDVYQMQLLHLCQPSETPVCHEKHTLNVAA